MTQHEAARPAAAVDDSKCSSITSIASDVLQQSHSSDDHPANVTFQLSGSVVSSSDIPDEINSMEEYNWPAAGLPGSCARSTCASAATSALLFRGRKLHLHGHPEGRERESQRGAVCA